MAKESLDVFVGFVLEYEISRPEHAHRSREALMSMAENKPVEGASFEATTGSLLDELDQFEQERMRGV